MIQLNPPIFIHVENSKTFMKTYPHCSRQKNIMVPYPTIDPDFYNSNHHNKVENMKREFLLFYYGGNHGVCGFIRGALNEIMKDDTIGWFVVSFC
jgi:hypothetical protein